MEEKDRYEYYPKQNQLYDKINNELYCLGIKQDITRLVDFLNLMNEDWWTLYERNKELREENQQLKKQLEEMQYDKNELISKYRYWRGECYELKQQLHELPKKIVGEVEKNFTEYLPLKYKTGAGFYLRLNAILKKYGGEDE